MHLVVHFEALSKKVHINVLLLVRISFSLRNCFISILLSVLRSINLYYQYLIHRQISTFTDIIKFYTNLLHQRIVKHFQV